MINNLDSGFYKGELKGKLLLHNQAFNKILGIDPPKSLVGSKASQFFIDPDDQEKYYEHLNKNGFIKNFTAQIKRPDGKVIMVELSAHLLYNELGEPKEVEGTILEVTEKYNLEQKLKESEEKYRNLVNNISDAIYETFLLDVLFM